MKYSQDILTHSNKKKSRIQTSNGSNCNTFSTDEGLSGHFSAVHINFGHSSAKCFRGSTKHVSCRSKQQQSP